MTRQLKLSNLYFNDSSQYKSDGLIKLFGLKNIELLLLETSGYFDNKEKIKLNFDHHKGMFGCLAMLKSIADEFEYASIDKFKRVKVFFLNAAGSYLHLWSLSYGENNLFDFFRERHLHIKPNFEDKQEFIPDLIGFCLSAKVVNILI
ncbi:uncharacterized protein RHIMIDRAFT_253084 [Rhizopus microsporus ATCC 52813]|uniref:Uncharacterized protein n=1 Tax=Rhizopus microsporus ATCC 52813 TaxID=1340429 RepID=A0A2G4T7X2_RHIZD|nr:uncharacterized protein RHIMIDRAFT_253084 [Rhizopus microsporus ATCC 52813]PHZ17125.1 hypothetical protein RHIMIDRAFT_253084 [Rhizopus microsporus ATCC 52813]